MRWGICLCLLLISPALAMGDGGFSPDYGVPVQGPAGPQGIQGVPGPQGPTGASGSGSAAVDASTFAGDWCAKVTLAEATIPNGGVVDTGKLVGSQSCAATLDILAGIKVLVGAASVTVANGQQIIETGTAAQLIGLAPTVSAILGNVAGDGLVDLTLDKEVVSHLRSSNSNTSAGSTNIHIRSAQVATISDVDVNGSFDEILVDGTSSYGKIVDAVGAGSADDGIKVVSSASFTIVRPKLFGNFPKYAIENDGSAGLEIDYINCEGGMAGCTALGMQDDPSGNVSSALINGGYEQVTTPGTAYNVVMGPYAGGLHGQGGPGSLQMNSVNNSGGAGCSGNCIGVLNINGQMPGSTLTMKPITTGSGDADLFLQGPWFNFIFDDTEGDPQWQFGFQPNSGVLTLQSSSVSASFRIQAPLNVTGDYSANGTPGVSCSGLPSASYTVTNGIVTHC